MFLFEVIHNVYRLSTLKLWKTRWKLWKTHPVFHRLHAARAKTRWKTPKFPVGNSALFDAKLLHSPRENVKIRYYQNCIIPQGGSSLWIGSINWNAASGIWAFRSWSTCRAQGWRRRCSRLPAELRQREHRRCIL